MNRRMIRAIAVMAGLFLCSGVFEARGVTTWYAAADGTSTNGTYGEPWSVDLAVGKTPNSMLKAGDTVIFKRGVYLCTETSTIYGVGGVLEFRTSGTPGAKITYKPEAQWAFAFDGGLLLTEACSNLVIRDFRIFYSGSTNRNRTMQYTHPPGITSYAEGTDLMHNLIENTGHPGIASWKTTRGKYIAGNIIRFVGIYDFVGYPGTARGSGMYLQNLDRSKEALVEGNISYFNNTTGLKAYGNTDIWGFRFARQICVDNNEAGIFYHLDNYGSEGVTIEQNYVWQGNPGIRIGYPLGNGNHSNAVVNNNYVVDSSKPFYVADGWSNITATNNIGINTSAYGTVWQLEVFGETSGDVASHQFSHNRYYSGPANAKAFSVKEYPTNFAGWQNLTRQDTNGSSWSQDWTNRGMDLFVFRPSTDSNFVHIAVYNWQMISSTSVSLATFFDAGDRLKLYDAQDLPNACRYFRYDGGLVNLDLTRTNTAQMLGAFSNRVWNGFNARFRAFLVQRLPPFIDYDGDGLDDEWEWGQFGTMLRDGTSDYDSDGMTDMDEYIAGTDPRDSASIFRISAMSPAADGSGMTFSWYSSNLWINSPYKVERCTNLIEGQWTLVGTQIMRLPPLNTWVDTNGPSDAACFYRITTSK